MSMNVLVITNLYPNKADPNRAPYNRQQVRALRTHARVRVVAPVFWTAPHARAVAAASPETWDGVEVHHPLYLYPPRFGRAFHAFCYLRSISPLLTRLWRQEPWDVLYGTWLFPDGHAVACAARRFGRPCVLKAHGSDVNEVMQHPLRRVLIRRAVKRAEAVVAVSRALCSRLVALGTPAGRAHLLYNGVDAKVFRPLERPWARRVLDLPEGDPLALFVGNLKQAKGPGLFVEALGRLSRNGRPFLGVILGTGPYRECLEDAIRRERLTGQIRLAGVADHEVLPTWYAAANVVCLPSFMEGVPNVVLEALACGRPVVASRVGGIPEVMDEACGALIPPGDVEALSDAMWQTTAREWDSQALARRIAHLSWDANARSLAGILRDATRGSA